MSAQTSLLENERRARPRSPSIKHVKILFNENKSIYDGLLKNVTAYGATVSLALTETLPKTFNLQFVNDNVMVPCQIKWRRADCVGVSF